MKSSTSHSLLRPFGCCFVLLSLVLAAGCGGGGGGGSAAPSPSPPPPPPPPTAIKINLDDLGYRIPDATDTLIYNVNVVFREHQDSTVISENTISTTVEIQYYNPPTNISGDIGEYVDFLEEGGFKVLKTVVTLGSGEQISSGTLAFRDDYVIDAYDDGRIYTVRLDLDDDGIYESYVLPFLPPLEAGQSSYYEYREFPDGFLWGWSHYVGNREFNVGNYSEIDVPLDEIEAYEISYFDENWYSSLGSVFGPDFITDYSFTQGKIWVHPKIGIVKLNLIVEEDEGYFEDGWLLPYEGYWTSEEFVWELSSVNFTTPTPQ